MGTFHFFARRQYLHTALLPRKAKIIPFLIILNIECLDFQGIFMVQLHLSIYVRSPEKSENHIPFINFISLFRRGELCSPLCFCFYTVTIKKRTEFPSAQTVDKPHSCEGLNGVLFERIVIFPNCDEKTCKYGIFVGIMVIL